MRHRYLLASLAVLSLGTAARAVEPSELKPGLVAAYSEPRKDRAPLLVTRLEPTPALKLAKGEAPHPRLAGLGSAKWTGYINITRPGKYSFDAHVTNGNVEVKLGGKPVLHGGGGGGVSDVTAVQLQLDGGVQSLEVSFNSLGGETEVAIYWQGPGFVREPLPHQFLGHLAKDRPTAVAWDLELEHGRFLFE